MSAAPLPSRIAAWMQANVPDFRGPANWTQFAGGRSNPTYRIDTPGGGYVLRRQPNGPIAPSAHAVDREFRMLRALEGSGCPAPRALALCTDRTVDGVLFYVMELVEGRLFWSGLLPEVAAEERRALHLALAGTLAGLHAVDWRADLADLARPGRYVERQVLRWRRQLEAASGPVDPGLMPLADALLASLPASEARCLIHGDYRIDNVLFDPAAPRAAAVIDWELATIGDPLADLTYYLVAWILPVEHGGMGGADLSAAGIPSLEEVAAYYGDMAGRDVMPALDWYMTFNLFRVAAMCEGIVERVRAGVTEAARAEGIAARVPVLAAGARAFAARAGLRI